MIKETDTHYKAEIVGLKIEMVMQSKVASLPNITPNFYFPTEEPNIKEALEVLGFNEDWNK